MNKEREGIRNAKYGDWDVTYMYPLHTTNVNICCQYVQKQEERDQEMVGRREGKWDFQKGLG